MHRKGLELVCKSPDELFKIAESLLFFAGESKVWTFTGELGAGKTTLIKEICKKCHVTDAMSSPSFSIVNEYRTVSEESIYHLDLYRINSLEEAVNIGIEEYLYSGELCLIEWPEIIEDLLPEDTLELEITIGNSLERIIKASKYE
ncbi:tRNA (adenosine(37)-N6)-threonylcarbamoyltransferase complex ATPase subunit type 1 TsaE [Chondrinema litorale]|uniref:tRNA (adenosine(37)-N6)-threonylcarbamoyltransferase complex ATPase subunit type 1 TsaE n=1 Tax=Chondrinema litorale TaxID=2994555 RepID=UPI002544C4A5|nr:tRNA (adenosine(37)-N6)-threonylcarbamoyltransferase complex ATPase subunit type 1 TsaE [Chondrinema litorale]UZR95654.1 tRNA (adenosine(37)-N6)-threonylcarbamoyltransferase complex ATPase subunit type 1 TsaE [Chondrinema litorale]